MKINIVKITLGTLAASVTAYFEKMLIPIAVLFAVMLLDYISGILSAYVKKELSSRIGIIGIIKKLCYLFIVASAIIFDFIIYYACLSLNLGIHYEPYFFCTLVSVWLIINELISILENLIKIGVPIPKFMEKAILAAKNKIEENGESQNLKGENENE
ncbi:MAG: phage holin family protein [Ruminococcaceae bacterium]|nr:phage holin family protein [Oscillospiraceae bacterium]